MESCHQLRDNNVRTINNPLPREQIFIAAFRQNCQPLFRPMMIRPRICPFNYRILYTGSTQYPAQRRIICPFSDTAVAGRKSWPNLDATTASRDATAKAASRRWAWRLSRPRRTTSLCITVLEAALTKRQTSREQSLIQMFNNRVIDSECIKKNASRRLPASWLLHDIIKIILL